MWLREGVREEGCREEGAPVQFIRAEEMWHREGVREEGCREGGHRYSSLEQRKYSIEKG